LKRENGFLRCDKCNKTYPSLRKGEIPILLRNPEGYLSEYLTEIIPRQLKGLKSIQSDHPRQAEVHIDRLVKMKEELRAFVPEFQTAPAKTKRYLEKYAEEMNNDEYILSAYAPYVGVRLPAMAYSECLYSTGLNLGVGVSKDATILDIGCGIGRTALDYSYLVPDGAVFGMDLEYSKIRIAYDVLKTSSTVKFVYTSNFEYKIAEIKGFSHRNIHLVVADAENLPYLADSFDLIIVEYLLGLLEEPERFLKSLSRFLKNNGILIIGDDHGWWERMRPRRRMTCPEMLEKALGDKFTKECEFDTPYFEILTDRVYHTHLTRFARYRKSRMIG
jgi:ubiquinone/menaquinone biosynthesis C-methylase UbiE